MVDSLKAALRLLPAVRPSIRGTSIGLCLRVSKARIHSTSEQSQLLALKVHPQVVNCEKVLPGSVGIVRFARAVLAYVGAGLSAVTANQLTGPSILQAKELGSSVGGNHATGAAEAGEMWQRTSVCRHVVQEDRSPKFSHSPLPHIVSKSQADASYAVAHSYHWNNSWGPVEVRFSPDAKVDSQWQSNSNTNRDHRSKLSYDDGLNSRFSKPTGLQALTADSSFSMKSNAGPMGSVPDYSAAAELELEWQFIIDPKSKAGLGTPISDGTICEEDDQVIFQSGGNRTREDEPENVKLVSPCEVGPAVIGTKSSKDLTAKVDRKLPTTSKKEIMTKCSKETMSPLETIHGETEKRPNLTSKQGPVFEETTEHQGLDSRSSMQKSLLRRTMDKEGSSLLCALKNSERVQNSQLLRASAKSLLGMPLSTFDITEKEGEMVRSADRMLLSALLHGNEPTRLENSGLPSCVLPASSDSTPAALPVHFQTVSQPLTIPSVVAHPPIRCGCRSLSADNRNTGWNGGGAMSMTSDSVLGLLGEALCHSQTRAREAEKQVQQAFEEQERLVRLLFREASQALTYQHWVTSLQTENMWLRKFAPNEPLALLHRSFVDPFSTVGRMPSRTWKDLDKSYGRCHMDHRVSPVHGKDAIDLGESNSNNIVMGCTLGIAFALGLSLAGAGLMIGWSMGWILLAYSVSV